MCVLTHVLLHRPKVVLDSPHSPSGCHEDSRPGLGAQIGSVRVKLEDLVSPSGRRIHRGSAYTQRVKLSQCW